MRTHIHFARMMGMSTLRKTEIALVMMGPYRPKKNLSHKHRVMKKRISKAIKVTVSNPILKKNPLVIEYLKHVNRELAKVVKKELSSRRTFFAKEPRTSIVPWRPFWEPMMTIKPEPA